MYMCACVCKHVTDESSVDARRSQKRVSDLMHLGNRPLRHHVVLRPEPGPLEWLPDLTRQASLQAKARTSQSVSYAMEIA